MSKIFIVLFPVLFLAFALHAQQPAAPRQKPNIFVYNEEDSPLAMDIGGGFGADNIGIRTGLAIHLDVYHIMGGFNYTISLGGSSKQQIVEKSFLLGYRYRSNHFMVALASGYGRQKYKCTSGSNNDCYIYKEETISATPITLQADWIVSDSFAFGMGLYQMFSKRTDVSAVMFNVKFGAFRNIY